MKASFHSTNKYHAQKVEWHGMRFDSKKEFNRYMELQIMEKAGLISNLKRQVPYIIIPYSKWGRAIKYIADFDYMEDGKHVLEDSKGVVTPLFKLKKRLVAERYGIEIRIT